MTAQSLLTSQRPNTHTMRTKWPVSHLEALLFFALALALSLALSVADGATAALPPPQLSGGWAPQTRSPIKTPEVTPPPAFPADAADGEECRRHLLLPGGASICSQDLPVWVLLVAIALLFVWHVCGRTFRCILVCCWGAGRPEDSPV